MIYFEEVPSLNGKSSDEAVIIIREYIKELGDNLTANIKNIERQIADIKSIMAEIESQTEGGTQ